MFEGILLFLHLAGLTVWIGSLVALLLVVVAVRRKWGEWDGKPMLLLVTQSVKWLLSIAALVVLVSGGVLIQRLGFTESGKPFWISFMEQAGGMTLLLFIVVMTLWSRRLQKNLQGAQPQQLSRYAIGLGAFVGLGAIVLLIVSLRVA